MDKLELSYIPFGCSESTIKMIPAGIALRDIKESVLDRGDELLFIWRVKDAPEGQTHRLEWTRDKYFPLTEIEVIDYEAAWRHVADVFHKRTRKENK